MNYVELEAHDEQTVPFSACHTVVAVALMIE